MFLYLVPIKFVIKILSLRLLKNSNKIIYSKSSENDKERN